MRSMRRKRRRNNFRQKTNVNFTVIIVIMCMAVILGYGTAKFVIYPVINGDTTKNSPETQQQTADNQSQPENPVVTNGAVEEKSTAGKEETNIVEDGLSVKQAENKGDAQATQETQTTQAPQATQTPQATQPVQVPTTPSGYCIQFGSFSTRGSAETLVSQLKTGGITAEIVEKDGAFKVISQLFQQKEQAVATLNSLSISGISDAFITPR